MTKHKLSQNEIIRMARETGLVTETHGKDWIDAGFPDDCLFDFAALVWEEGYRQGIEDERTSEANIGICGFNAKIEPNRQNPYKTAPQPISQEQTQPDSNCREDDGCPTELAVLQRFWREQQPVSQEPVAIGTEWKPCVKLPIVVHVRDQREGESHVSTREGITPVRPDDLIMRGVAGEEYPIGRELFNKTYTFDTAPQPLKEVGLTGQDLCNLEIETGWTGDSHDFDVIVKAVIAKLKEKNK